MQLKILGNAKHDEQSLKETMYECKQKKLGVRIAEGNVHTSQQGGLQHYISFEFPPQTVLWN